MTRLERSIVNAAKNGKIHKWTSEEKVKFKDWIKNNEYELVKFDTGHPVLNKMFPKASKNAIYTQWTLLRKELLYMLTPREVGITIETKNNGNKVVTFYNDRVDFKIKTNRKGVLKIEAMG